MSEPVALAVLAAMLATMLSGIAAIALRNGVVIAVDNPKGAQRRQSPDSFWANWLVWVVFAAMAWAACAWLVFVERMDPGGAPANAAHYAAMILGCAFTALLWRIHPSVPASDAEDPAAQLREEILRLADDPEVDRVALLEDLAMWREAELRQIREHLLAQAPPRLLDKALDAFENATRKRIGPSVSIKRVEP